MEEDVSRNLQEQLSAFLDGELPEAELQLLVRRLERDSELRATLARYSAIGGILRRDPLPAASLRIGDSLQQALDAEHGEQPVAAEPQRLKPLFAAGFAIAAVAALLALNPFAREPSEAPIATVAATVQEPESQTVQPAGARPTVSRSSSVERLQRAYVNRDRMTSYMVSHGEYARSFQGPLANPRIFVQQANFEE